MNYIWNGKIRGIFGAFFLGLASVTNKLWDVMTTVIVRNNLQKVGKHIKIHHGIIYRYPAHISLGNNVIIGHQATFNSETNTGTLEIEDGVTVTEHCRIDFSGNVTIGKNTLISKNVTIETHDHGYDPHSKPVCRSLIIGENVWIGMNTLILSNVCTIGDHAIIASGSVVTNPVPENCVVGGVPARIIKNMEPGSKNRTGQ